MTVRTHGCTCGSQAIGRTLAAHAGLFSSVMTPEEFRRYGHQLVDWIADYRAGIEQRPVMSPVEPGQIKAKLPSAPPERAEPFDAVLRDVRGDPGARPVALAEPALLRLLPGQQRAVLGARGLPEHRAGRAGPVLAGEPGAHRAGGGDDGLDAADGRPVGRLERRHPGHGLDQHAGGADLRPRARLGLRAGQGWSAGRRAPAHRVRLRAQPQLGREGCAPRGLRARVRARHRGRQDALRGAARRAARRNSGRPRQGLEAVCHRGHDRHHDLDRASTRWGRSPSWRSNTAPGCTWMPRWRARR